VKAQVEKAAGLLHIEQYLDRYPNKLSGGQRQRVAVARALAVEPKVLLMDEPLSNLDALLRLEMRTELKTVLQSAGTTTIYVTHDQTEAMGLSDRIAVMHGGVVEQVGHPVEIYNHPATRFVGGFIGNPPMNFIKVPVSNGQVAAGSEQFAAPGESGNEVILGLRGEAVELAPLPQGLEMRVRVAEPMGSHLLLTGSIHDQPVRVILPASETVKSGETIGLKLDQKRITWLSPESGKSFPAVLA